MNELVKAFKHIARDILIYILPGLTFLSFTLFVCVNLYGLSNWDKLLTSQNIIFLIIAAYIIGHIILGIVELFVLFKIDSFLKRKIYTSDYLDLQDSKKKMQNLKF